MIHATTEGGRHWKRTVQCNLAELQKKEASWLSASSIGIFTIEFFFFSNNNPGCMTQKRSPPVADIRAIRILISIAAYYENEIMANPIQQNPENPSTETRVECYCDAGFELIEMTLRPQQDILSFLNGGAVIWKAPSKVPLQNSAQNLNTNCIEAAMEAIWIRKFSQVLVVVPTINEPLNRRIRILKFQQHRYNLADPFTKALSNRKLTQHARGMGLRPASSFM
ncbi:hypothetical protein Tco_0633874 [Tanacetum coccineum]